MASYIKPELTARQSLAINANNNYMIECIKTKLKEKKISIKELALAIGYTKPNNFYPKMRGETILGVDDITKINLFLPNTITFTSKPTNSKTFLVDIYDVLQKEIEEYLTSFLITYKDNVSFLYIGNSNNNLYDNYISLFYNEKDNSLYCIDRTYHTKKFSECFKDISSYFIELVKKMQENKLGLTYDKDKIYEYKIDYETENNGVTVKRSEYFGFTNTVNLFSDENKVHFDTLDLTFSQMGRNFSRFLDIVSHIKYANDFCQNFGKKKSVDWKDYSVKAITKKREKLED